MASWAELDDDNIVIRTVVISNDFDDEGEARVHELYGGRWIQTSYNTRGGVHYDPETGEPSADQSKALRGNFAGPGMTYDEQLDVFLYPKPYPSWVLNQSYEWEAPTPCPVDDFEGYEWNEQSGDWVAIVIPADAPV